MGNNTSSTHEQKEKAGAKDVIEKLMKELAEHRELIGQVLTKS